MISVLDVLSVEPGRLGEVHRLVRGQLAPLMAELEMHLLRTWMTPAVELRAADRPAVPLGPGRRRRALAHAEGRGLEIGVCSPSGTGSTRCSRRTRAQTDVRSQDVMVLR